MDSFDALYAGEFCRIQQGCSNVIPFQIGIIGENLRGGHTGGEKFQNRLDRVPQPAYDWFAMTNLRIDLDTFKKPFSVCHDETTQAESPTFSAVRSFYGPSLSNKTTHLLKPRKHRTIRSHRVYTLRCVGWILHAVTIS
jgi:hypothetical protein